MNCVNEPTALQCSGHEKVFDSGGTVGYAIWYPQMGGYVAKAVALIDKEWEERDNGSRIGGCIDMLVWHDGDFPFDDAHKEQLPRKIHHCDPKQFIAFGKTLARLNDAQAKSQK